MSKKEKRSYQDNEDIKSDIEESIYNEAIDGDVDAQKTMLQLQQDKAVENKINELFFPDTECEH